MASNKHSIAQARQALEHVTTAYGDEGTIIDACREGIVILAWLERRQDLMRALERLERERPEIVDLFKEFPDAKIVNVRRHVTIPDPSRPHPLSYLEQADITVTARPAGAKGKRMNIQKSKSRG